jgi:hypothetical protein
MRFPQSGHDVENYPFPFVLVGRVCDGEWPFFYLLRAPTALGPMIVDQLAACGSISQTAEFRSPQECA